MINQKISIMHFSRSTTILAPLALAIALAALPADAAPFDGKYSGTFTPTQGTGRCGTGKEHTLTIEDGKFTMDYGKSTISGTVDPSGGVYGTG